MRVYKHKLEDDRFSFTVAETAMEAEMMLLKAGYVPKILHTFKDPFNVPNCPETKRIWKIVKRK